MNQREELPNASVPYSSYSTMRFVIREPFLLVRASMAYYLNLLLIKVPLIEFFASVETSWAFGEAEVIKEDREHQVVLRG